MALMLQRLQKNHSVFCGLKLQVSVSWSVFTVMPTVVLMVHMAQCLKKIG